MSQSHNGPSYCGYLPPVTHFASLLLLPLSCDRVIQNSGFGHPARQPHPTHSLQHVLISLLQEAAAPAAASGSTAASPTQPQQQQQHDEAPAAATPASSVAGAAGASAAAAAEAAGRQQAVAARAAVARGFVNRLFSTLNWTLTEFTVAVGELHNLRGQRSILEVQNQYRRTGLMFELSVNFLRLLEFVVVSAGCCVSQHRVSMWIFNVYHYPQGLYLRCEACKWWMHGRT